MYVCFVGTFDKSLYLHLTPKAIGLIYVAREVTDDPIEYLDVKSI